MTKRRKSKRKNFDVAMLKWTYRIVIFSLEWFWIIGLRVVGKHPNYDWYIRHSIVWQFKRWQNLREAKGKCQTCNSRKRLDCHHRTYDRLGYEPKGDITVLCRVCHQSVHNGRRRMY